MDHDGVLRTRFIPRTELIQMSTNKRALGITGAQTEKCVKLKLGLAPGTITVWDAGAILALNRPSLANSDA